MQSLSIKQIDAEIKRINWRISDIAKRYGTESQTYKDQTAFLYDVTESKDSKGNITSTRTLKKQYANLTHYVTTKEGNTYIALDRTKKAKEIYQEKLASKQDNQIAKMYNQARKVKTQGQLERTKLGTRLQELQEQYDKKEITKEELKKQKEEEIERVSKIADEFKNDINDMYEKYTDKEIQKEFPQLFNTGKRSYSELEELSNLIKQKSKSKKTKKKKTKNKNKNLPLGG